MHVCVWVRLAVLSRHVVSSSATGTRYFNQFGCVDAYCALCLSFFVSLYLCLFGRDSNRTSGELLAVLTQLQLGKIPTRGLLERVVLCCLFSLARRSDFSCSWVSSGATACSCAPGSRLAYE